MTDDESVAHATLLAEHRALEEEYSGQDEYPEEIDARLGQLEMAMEALEQRPLIYDPAEVGRAGVFVTLDRDGSLAVYRGYVRPEDEPREVAAVQDGDGADAMGQGESVFNWKPSATSTGAQSSRGWSADRRGPFEEDEAAEAARAAGHGTDGHRTLRCGGHRAFADVALTLLLKLVTDTFTSSATGCFEVAVRHVYMSAQRPN